MTSSVTKHCSYVGDIVRIHNPLIERQPDELDQDVRSFHRRVRLGTTVDVDVLVRGARAAQEPTAIDDIPGITRSEKSALDDEKQWGFRAQTEELKVAILVTACSAIIQSATPLKPISATAIYLTRATGDGSNLPSTQQPLVGPGSGSSKSVVLRMR